MNIKLNGEFVTMKQDIIDNFDTTSTITLNLFKNAKH